MQRAITERVFPGCVVGIVERGNAQSQVYSYGHLTYETGALKTNVVTPYDIASITKVFTALTLLKLVEEKKIALDEPVAHYIPEFDNAFGKNRVLVRHLLAYTLDLELPSLASLKEKPREIVGTVIRAPLRSTPGTKVLCVNATAVLMGLIIERTTLMILADLIHGYFLEPLGLLHTTFKPLSLFQKEWVAPTEICPWRKKMLQGEVHDESTYALGGHGLGAAGLFSTVPDLLTLMEMLINGGEMRAKRYFAEEMILAMCTANQKILGGHISACLGWLLAVPRYMGERCSPATFGMTGFTGCSMVCDYMRGVGIVILSNRIWPIRPENSDAINALRRDVADIVYRHRDNK